MGKSNKKAVVVLFGKGEVRLSCEDHPLEALREHFDEGYLTCDICGSRFSMGHVQDLVREALITAQGLLNLLEEGP